MRKKLAKMQRRKLVSRAKLLVENGYSVIPIQGDLSSREAKKPAVKWRAFQKRIAEKRELQVMFDSRAGALGIVCGQVSQLLVIDFDDHLRYQRFCRHMPQYAGSYTVKTRRGYHVYFRTREKVPSHQFDGGDIKGEKSYVVAAPSVISGVEYKAVRRGEPMWVDKGAVDSLLMYFHAELATPVVSRLSHRVAAEVDIVAMYERLCDVIGRNNALYRCASVGRAQGMMRGEIESALLERHVLRTGGAKHKYETYADRLREGRATIASALNGALSSVDGDGIPNTVRERLLQAQGSAVTARLVDVLYAAGWRSESYFCMRDAIELGSRFGLNRKSVMSALTGECSSFNGRHIIARRYVEYLDIGGLKSGRRGRPVELLFQAPSVSRLLEVLGVSWSPSDVLTKVDLGSSHAYRRALHREYVKRLSPQTSMSVLAGRLGVNPRTLRRYNADLGVQVSESVGRFLLSWETLRCLPRRERNQSRNQTPGYWLQIGESARFPAWRHIGAELLRKRGDAVFVCARRASILSLGKAKVRPVVYGRLSIESFLRLRARRGGAAGGPGLLGQLRSWLRKAGELAGRIRYERLRLQYDNVASHIAEDKVAESIRGYLVAEDSVGVEVRRPARRGVAYRMLKQFGEGNVYLALRDSYSDLMAAMARHAARVGDEATGAGLLARSMA